MKKKTSPLEWSAVESSSRYSEGARSITVQRLCRQENSKGKEKGKRGSGGLKDADQMQERDMKSLWPLG